MSSAAASPTWMARCLRYPKLYFTMARYCLAREMAFRVNFAMRVVAVIGWLALMIFYFDRIFANTESIGDWSRSEYLFLMGTWFVVFGLVETLFLENCTRFSELVRQGNLDFALLKPIDEQFLLSFERIDWAEVPGVLFGVGVLVFASQSMGIVPSVVDVAAFTLLVLAGIAVLYSFMLALASVSVWVVRTQSLQELWFYVIQFGRYPAEIYGGNALGYGLRLAFTFVVPVLLAVNIPARFAVKSVEPLFVGYLLGSAVFLLIVSRWFFQFALRQYRSASS